jgi:hypothetical protein
MFPTRLLAAAAFAAVMCVPAYADDAYPPPNSPPTTQPNPLTADESTAPPKYDQIPQDYEEFAAVYNKALTFLRTTGSQSIHKCFPAGITPSALTGWCQDFMTWGDPKGQRVTVSTSIHDDGKQYVLVCFSGDDMTRRCYRDDGAVFDQSHDYKADLWVTFRHIAGAWNERGKPLSDLNPNAPNPPAATASQPATTASQPAATASPPAAEPSQAIPDDIRSQFTQIPNDYDEFTSGYNKVLAFLHDVGAQPIRHCFHPGDDPHNLLHGWCNNMMRWGNPKEEHISAGENQQDDGPPINVICLGADHAHERCFFGNGSVRDQLLNPQTHVYVTYRDVAGKWEERGKPLSDLKPRASSPPAAAPSPPADESVLPPKYDQIPHDYDEFAAVYNKALAFLRTTGTQSAHKCFPPKSDPNDSHGWCQEVMWWANPNGQHIGAIDTTQDNGNHVVSVCLGDDMTTQRCYRDNGEVVNQNLDRKIDIWVTFRQVAGAWNERGKPLSNLAPRANRNIKR